MTGPFESRHGSVSLRLTGVERSVLSTVPALLDVGDDAGGRLSYVAHPGDAEADDGYQSLVANSLDDLRRVDRTAFDRVMGGEPVALEDIEAFMRVVGEARLVLAARIGIEDEGWEDELGRSVDPEVALLAWLGFLQDAAVQVLSAHL